MYPTITIGTLELHMTGLGILAGLITFIVTAYILSRRHTIQFIKLFYRLPLPIILGYIMGSYGAFVAGEGVRLPTSLSQLERIVSPYGYHFHIVGILIAIIISLRIFFKKIPSKHERRVRINVIASSISLSLIPLGIGLLMGDSLIGLPTDSRLGVESFRPDASRRSSYGNIYPIGLFIAITGLLTFVRQRISEHKTQPSGQGYLALAILTIAIAYIRTLVNTPKYLVMQVGPMRRDITTYVAIGIAMICTQRYINEKHKSNQQHKV